MLGKLTDAQIDQVLHSEYLGRIGCHADDKVYIVPVTYVYSDGYVYAHSKEGMKVKMMRKNPYVCFQVDAVENMTNWRSVILWGLYEELKSSQEQQAAMKVLMDRLTPFTTSETVRAARNISSVPKVVEKSFKPVAYRIRITEKTGRYEKS